MAQFISGHALNDLYLRNCAPIGSGKLDNFCIHQRSTKEISRPVIIEKVFTGDEWNTQFYYHSLMSFASVRRISTQNETNRKLSPPISR